MEQADDILFTRYFHKWEIREAGGEQINVFFRSMVLEASVNGEE